MQKSILELILKPVLVPLAFAAIIIGGLLVLDQHTSELRSEQARRAFHETLLAVAPIALDEHYSWKAFGGKALSGETSPSVQSIYPIYQNGYQGAVVKIVATGGYNGPIHLLVGLRANHQVHRIRILKHYETPGLGDQMESHKSSWLEQFSLQSLFQPLVVNQHLTGATVTEQAVLRGLDKAFIALSPTLKQLARKLS